MLDLEYPADHISTHQAIELVLDREYMRESAKQMSSSELADMHRRREIYRAGGISAAAICDYDAALVRLEWRRRAGQ